MYWILKSLKISLVFSIMVVMLLNGCATSRYSTTPYYQQTDSYNKPQELYHTVQSGETLSSIGRIYGVDYKDIATWNQIAPPYTIYPGQSLRIYPSGSDTVSYDDSGIPVSTSPLPQGRQLGKSSTYKASSYKKSTPSGKTTGSGGTYHTVKRGETLYSIAKRYGQDYRTVAKWNNISSPYTLRVGQRLRVAATRTTQTKQISQSYSPSSSLSLPNSPPQNNVVSHIVQAGDTVSSIAQQYGYGIEQIAYWNGLSPPYDLQVGRRLRVAPLPTTGKASTSRTTGSYSNSRKTGYSSATTSRSYHQVVAGDTLYSIARTYGAGVADIAIWNNLQPPYTLTPGQTLQVAPSNSSNPNRPSLNSSVRHNTGYHTVASGDTLYSIAKLYNYSASEIASWNRLRYPYYLQVGQSLRVYPPSGVLDKIRYKVPLNTASSGKPATTHTVIPEETLYSISRRYGYHVNQLAAWNGLVPPYRLIVGQQLRVSP
ncbi:MAG: LysM peptidoglycan-binding domain-containing protein [Thioploca sp.]|nr:LysM peptidoglycan-binding domain-containing protein [Thioploca sp.]